MISEEKIKEYEGILEADKERLMAQVKKYDTRPDFENEPGYEDEANESVESFDQSAEETLYREKLSHVEDALNRIKKGTFGICRNCQGEISEEMLDIIPETDLCQNCKKEINN